MPKKSDHDLLLEIKTHVEYIRADIKRACEERKALQLKTKECRQWRDKMDTKLKFVVGIATFIGGVVVWIADQAINIFNRK